MGGDVTVDLRSLRDALQGSVIAQGEPGYDEARIVWNAMIDRRPAAIARCASVEDVARTVSFARDASLPLAVRGGGHSVGGFSTCDDGIVLDLAGLNEVRVDPERREAVVGGGALLGALDAAAQAHGLACPVGLVSHTGVGGLTLGGGMGRLQRKHGFTIDNLLAVEVVTADGRAVRASEEEEPELFWGMRGAGANFGVATSFTFRLHPVGPMVTQGWAAYPVQRAAEVAARFADAHTAPDEMMPTLALSIVSEEDPWPDLVGRPVAILGVTHCGSPERAAADIAGLLPPDPLSNTIEEKTYLQAQSLFDDTLAWGKRFYMKGGFTAAITPELIDASLEHIVSAPGACGVSFWAQGGAIGRVPADATAFTGRDAPFWMGAETFWEDPAQDDTMVGWGREAWAALTPFTTSGHYVNDLVETGEDVARAIYGDAKYERLVALKRTFDPGNVFRMNQNIRP